MRVEQGGVTVLTVTLNPATGAYAVTQNAPISHAPGANENNQGFFLAYTVTDVDGDSAAGTLAMNVNDDIPVATASGTQPLLSVDETDLTSDAAASFAGVFATAFGPTVPPLPARSAMRSGSRPARAGWSTPPPAVPWW